MANTVLMPQAGITVESCVIGNWKKAVGDTVTTGDILFDYETDKALFECESTFEGTLLAILAQDGEEVPVLTPVGVIGMPGEDISFLTETDGAVQLNNNPDEKTVVEVPHSSANAKPQPMVGSSDPMPAGGEGCKISPRAMTLASKLNVDLTMIKPTGAHGRIIEQDVRRAADEGWLLTGSASAAIRETGIQNHPEGTGIGGRVSVDDVLAAKQKETVRENISSSEEDYTEEEFSRIRRVIATSMKESILSIPQLTHNFSFDASSLKNYRKMLKECEGVSSITIGDMIMFAVSRIILKYPNLNAHMIDDTHIRKFHSVNLGFACDTPRGLMVPVVRNAETKSLKELSEEIARLADQARKGSLSPDYMSRATFTVSNLGTYGVESFTPIINVPQTGILGVDMIVDRVRQKDGEIGVYPAMGLSLTYDHRAIDGAPASRFVQELCHNLENFPALLAL